MNLQAALIGLIVEQPNQKTRSCTAGSRQEILAEARASMRDVTRLVHVRERGTVVKLTVTRCGIGPIQTPHGYFHQMHFVVNDIWRDYHAIVACQGLRSDFSPIFRKPATLLLRIDSGCSTGQIYLDRTCECREQLITAMQRVNEEGEGAIICIPRQDGRGMGIDFKLATLMLQKRRGDDTYDAATAIAGSDVIDVRTYAGAAAILQFWDVPAEGKIRLLTNNPEKMDTLRENGFCGELEHVPLIVPPTIFTSRHLKAKRDKLKHLL